MKKLAILLTGILAFAFAAATANADSLKIGVVNVQEILQKSPVVKKYNTELKSKFKARQEKLVKLSNALRNDQAKLNRDSAVLSATDREKLQAKILTQQVELRKMAQDYQNDFTQAQTSDMHDLYNKISSAVAKVAKQRSLELVLEKQAAPYASAQYDVTNDVLKEMK